MKITNLNLKSNQYKTSFIKHNILTNIPDTLGFKGHEVKDISKLTPRELLGIKIKFFIPMQKNIRQNKEMIREVSQKYLKDYGNLDNNSLLTFEQTYAGGYFNPIDSGIVINKKQPQIVAISKFLPEYFDYDKYFRSINFTLACHESQHKVQATQVFRLEGMQEKFINMLNDYVKKQTELLNKLESRNIFDDKLEKLNADIKVSKDKNKVKEIKKEIKLLNSNKKILLGQLKSERKKIKNFDIEKNKTFYNKVLKQKGFIPKGTEEEAIALKYMDAFENYPPLLSKFQCIADFGSIEAHQANVLKIHKDYKNNYLEIDANEKAKSYTESHSDLIKQYYEKMK